MKKALVDINIILDMLAKRDDHLSAVQIFDLCAKRVVKGHLCSHEITTISYFLEKFSYPRKKATQIISGLLDVFSIIPATETILRDALQSPIKDFEDAVIEVSAIREKVDCIITRNLKDFKPGRVECFTGSEYLSLISAE
jgi:predicted nucleic-acid-binding protein